MPKDFFSFFFFWLEQRNIEVLKVKSANDDSLIRIEDSFITLFPLSSLIYVIYECLICLTRKIVVWVILRNTGSLVYPKIGHVMATLISWNCLKSFEIIMRRTFNHSGGEGILRLWDYVIDAQVRNHLLLTATFKEMGYITFTDPLKRR